MNGTPTGGRPTESPLRESLRLQLSRFDPSIAELHGRALELLGAEISRAQMTLLAHAVRELINEFAALLAIADGVDLPDPKKVDDEVRRFVHSWTDRDVPLHEDGLAESAGLRPIPDPVYQAASRLIASHTAATVNARQSRALVASRHFGEVSAASRELDEAWEVFRPHFHLSRGKPKTLPTEEVLRHAFETVETIAFARLANFFEVMEDLDDILLAANRRTTEGSDDG